MSARRITLVALSLALGLLLVRLATGPLQQNLARTMAVNAFFSQAATSRSVELLHTALSLNCAGSRDCAVRAVDSVKSVLEQSGGQFMPDLSPIQIISDSARIPIEQFVPSGLPASLQGVAAPGVLYGPGTLKLRLFLVSEMENCWQIAVRAKHDDPPPVDLEIWLDREKAGVLSYDRGDQSWETLSLNVPIAPNLHSLGVTFANDYLDEAAGADRNAYIEYVEITRLEDWTCAHE